MARIEKTVFISYRRKDISWALAVYQYLTSQKYDVFFDYTSLSGGDFEQVIVSNIRARAHFVLILTPTALDRCNEPGDWLRREIETAVDEKRNIIPLFFDGFSFGLLGTAEKLTGKLVTINRYNGLDVPAGYFIEAMERLRYRYLNIPLSAVIHPVSTEVRKKINEEKVAANKALREQKNEIKELVKPVQEKSESLRQTPIKKVAESPSPKGKKTGTALSLLKWVSMLHPYFLGAGILLLIVLGFVAIKSFGIAPVIESTSIPVMPTLSWTIGSEVVSDADGMVLLYVPEGMFPMGNDTDGRQDERPLHSVYLPSFWVDKYEVTNSMYLMCVQAGICDPPDLAGSKTRANYYAYPDFKDYPVIYVSWYDANTYCNWANRRLPTEAEWEKAAGWDEEKEQKNLYPWGDRIDCGHANYESAVGSCRNDTYQTGEGSVSPYGVYNMVGNVWEWVADWYNTRYYENSTVLNPVGPDLGTERVARGGGWTSLAADLRVTNRKGFAPEFSGFSVGFRCAMDTE